MVFNDFNVFILIVVKEKKESNDSKELKLIENGDSEVMEERLKSKNVNKKRKRKGTGSGKLSFSLAYCFLPLILSEGRKNHRVCLNDLSYRKRGRIQCV